MAMPGMHSAAGDAATPKYASRRSSRRSWFDTPPATPCDIAVEKQPVKTMSRQNKRRSIDDIETLVLSHFTKPPRIGFGKIIVGRSKTRVLLVQNPADYDQEVVIERFPHKKGFNVDQAHFVVQPEEVVSLTLTWTPQDAGGCREMILFHISDVYRLQAYVFGTADDPKPVKKGRKGMLGTHRRQPPPSVMQTKSLKSIQDSYSPRKSDETRELRSHVRPTTARLHADQENVCPAELEKLVPQTPPPLESTAICRDEVYEQKAMERRTSGFISPTLSKMSPIPLMADTNNGCIMESYLSTTTGHHSPVHGCKEEERSPLKSVTGNRKMISSSQGKNSRESDKEKSDMHQSKRTSGRNGSSEAEKPAMLTDARVYVSPNSFLNDSLAGKTTASTAAEVGRICASSQVGRGADKATVSPNSFVQNMGSKHPTPLPHTSSIPSPSAVLNDSIPHNVMMKQLEHVRKSLHDGSFHESPVLSAAMTQVKPANPAGKAMDRLSQLAQPKARGNVFAHAQRHKAPAKKEKLLLRKIHEKARFAKITDAPSPRRKTFLVTKKQQGRKASPQKTQPRNIKPAGKGAEAKVLLSGQSSSCAPKRPTSSSELAKLDGGRVDSRTVKKEQREREVVFPEHSNVASIPGDLGDDLTQDDTMANRRRSMWASPAVAGFVSPVIAVQSDCDSTGDDRHMLDKPYAQGNKAEDCCRSSQVSVQQVTLTPETSDILKSASHGVEVKGRRSSGRRLFPDMVSEDLNLSKDFRPLWSGSATVTKDRSSISPPLHGSADSSKKLFPNISATAASGLDSKPSEVGLSCDSKGEGADGVQMADIVDMGQAVNHAARGRQETQDTAVGANKVEIVDMAVASCQLPEEKTEKSCAESDAEKVEVVDMALNHGLTQREKTGSARRLFDDLQNTQEKSAQFEWHSPQQLLQSPDGEAHRRSTLTVTKSRPSQALLQACSQPDGGDTAMESQPATPQTYGKENDSDELWQSETIVIETKNNNVVSFTVHREVLTPSQLPTSPLSENSRRSTHAVRNPVVLNRDGLLPKNLFGYTPESKIPSDVVAVNDKECKSEMWGVTSMHREQNGRVMPESGVEGRPEIRTKSDSRQSTAQGDTSSPAVCTDRVEHHIHHQPDRLTCPAPLCTPCHDRDNSVSSQELSTDSLEAEKKTSSSIGEQVEEDRNGNRHIEACKENIGRDDTDSTSPIDGKECIADVNTELICANKGGTSRQRVQQWASHSETRVSEQCRAKPATLQQSFSHHPSAHDTSQFLSMEQRTARCRQDEPRGSSSQEDVTESLTEITPFPSVTSVESKGDVAEASGQPEVDHPDPSHTLVRETLAQPIISCNVVQQPLLKKGSMTEKTVRSSSSATWNCDRKTSSCQAQLTRSLSADLQSSISQPSESRKPPVAFNIREGNAPHQRAKKVLAAVPRSQVIPRTRSQGNLNRSKQGELQSSFHGIQQTEQVFNRKRSSPEAGLKPPRSKRVELERHSMTRGQQQQASTQGGPAPSRPRAGRAAAKPSKGVALSKLILVKKSKTALPKHPLPFAAKNMYYDERWQDKQERGFVHWLNFVLTPADEYVLATTKTKVDARTIAFDGTAHQVAPPRLAPTKEVLSFRAYAARRRLNHLRRASCHLFQSEAVVRVVCRLETEVERRRLAVRTDRMVHADTGLKQKILDLLLSYNPLWLRIGLETVYGEVLPVQTNNDVIGMSRFILTRLLTSPDISAHYAHPTVPHLYHDGYADAVAQHMLKKFLVLVYFLDCAKQSRLITHDPCLFCKDAEVKSTKAMLIQFSRDFLSGEGDVTKHLAYLGYLVSHLQTPLDEFDYAVTNLCTDLRDGVRLGRIVMLLSGDWSAAPSFRAPAISRLQKIHNVELVFKQLTGRGLDLHTAKGGTVSARDIVDGHREKTLAFLWKLIFHFQTMAMLNEQELQEEVDILQRTLRVKVCMQRMLGHPPDSNSVARRDSGGDSVPMDNPMMQLLLKWCRTVCLHYGVKVENFTVSFSDGRALCCLLHHYHPALLPLSLIHFRTSQSLQEAAESAQDGTGADDSELSQDWGVFPLGGEMDQSLFETLLVNEKENFRNLYEKVSELGGIPLMLKASDMSNTIPDERVVVTYVSYLCARLLDLREETRAARIIQLAWRRFCLRRSARLRQKCIAACIIIQRAWRQYLVTMTTQRLAAAAVCVQSVWRGRQARHKVTLLRQARANSAMHQAATTIQTCVRCFLTRQHFQRKLRSAIVIQSAFRTLRAQRAFIRQRQACGVIQKHFRAHLQGAAVRQQFVSLKHAAVVLQKAFRRRRLQQMEHQNQAACVMQSVWRGKKCRQEILHQRQAAVCVQSWWRAVRAERRYVTMMSACTIIQQHFRAARLGAQHRQNFLQLRHAVMTLQRHVRGAQQRQQFHRLRKSATTVQTQFRGYRCRVRFQALRLAAVVIQTAVRAHQARNAARQRFVAMKLAAVSIQRWYRQQAGRRVARREAAARQIQAWVRGHHARRDVEVLRAALRREAAAVTIQNFCRVAMARRQLHALQLEVRKNQAALKIQAGFRGFITRRQAQVMRYEARRERACITIQCAYRRFTAVREMMVLQAAARQDMAARTIQMAVRKFFAVKTLRALQLEVKRERAAIRIQCAYRGHAAVKAFRALQHQARRQAAATRIQAAFRRHVAVRELRSLQQAARQTEAAVRIQCAFRRHCAVKRLRALQVEASRQMAAVRIQSTFRGYLAVRVLRALQLAARREASALTIQSAYRGHMARCHVRTLRDAARQNMAVRKIQAWVRGRQQCGRYLEVRRAVLLLQTYTRGYLARKRCGEMRQVLLMLAEYHHTQEKFQVVIAEFHQQWTAAVTVQSAWRGWRHRQSFLHTRSSVCTLQAAVRGRVQRKQFLLLKGSASVIQRWFRAQCLGRATRLRYQLMVGAAVVIQSCWKMYAVRSYYLQLRARVTCAQAQCRAFLARTQFQRQRQAAVCLQRRFRAWAVGQQTRRDFQKRRHFIVRLQALVRAKQQRKHFQRQRRSCIKIQAGVRGWLAWRHYQNQLRSAVTLQRKWRARQQGREELEKYRETRAAVTTLQAYTRGYLARRHVHRLGQAARVIQNGYRGHQTRRQFLCARTAAVTLQRHIRIFLQARQKQREFVRVQEACVKIQSAYRGHLARQRYVRCQRGMVRLQALVRARQERRRYLALHTAVLLCQNRYRARRIGQVFRSAFLIIREAAVVIQKHMRGHRLRQELQRQRSSAVLLQAQVRGWLQRRQLTEQRQAAVCLQQQWRAKRAGRMSRQNFMLTRCAAVTIQRGWRRHQQTQRQNAHHAATVIQKHVRRYFVQSKFRSDMVKIVRLQAAARGFLVRRSASEQLCAVRVIQRRWRETLLVRQCRHKFLLMREAAVVIQSVFRGHRARVDFSLAVKRVLLLQAMFRGCLQHRKYLQLRQTVLALQRRVRSKLIGQQERNSFLQKRRCAVCIQTALRRWRSRREERKTQAATCLQAYIRMLPVRRRFLRLKAAVTVLQSALRGHIARQAVHQRKAAILQIQRRVHFYLMVQCLRREVYRRRAAAVTIQRAFRGHLARVQSQKCEAAINIQAAFRAFAQRRQFQRQKQAALTLQCGVRGWRDRRQVREMRNMLTAAVVIQRCFRAWKQRRKEKERQMQRAEYLKRYMCVAGRHLAVMRIQRWYRQVMLMRQARQQVHSVIVLQQRVRAFLQRVRFLRARREAEEWRARREGAVKMLQSAVRRWLLHRKEQRRIQLITRVQAMWRGRQLRCGLKSKKIAAARRRVQAANEKATEEKTLGKRTASALDFLLHYKQLAYILDALMHLEVATRLSWVCCERLVEVNAVGVIFRLILSCNRSLPHMELIKFSVSVLLNLAKYEKTTQAVYEAEDAVTTLVDLMSIYRDKGGAIFTKTCMLLALLGSDVQRKAEMCADKRLVDKLQSIHALVLRKHRMQASRARVMAARASLNATLPSRLHGGPARGAAGKVRPAWVLRRDSVHDIEDPLAAISFLLDTLHLGPK
ncbi:uncharacterized protein LOC143289805 [Babylonia areolata]|uniref:uncharacterized protein LOC143289805 n=1 Tax=Babylonia areolata TaxID=304850 RepID=UPI003FD2A4DA